MAEVGSLVQQVSCAFALAEEALEATELEGEVTFTAFAQVYQGCREARTALRCHDTGDADGAKEHTSKAAKHFEGVQKELLKIRLTRWLADWDVIAAADCWSRLTDLFDPNEMRPHLSKARAYLLQTNGDGPVTLADAARVLAELEKRAADLRTAFQRVKTLRPKRWLKSQAAAITGVAGLVASLVAIWAFFVPPAPVANSQTNLTRNAQSTTEALKPFAGSHNGRGGVTDAGATVR